MSCKAHLTSRSIFLWDTHAIKNMLLLVHTFAWLPIELARFAIIKLKNVDLVNRVCLIYCYRLHSYRWQCKLNLKEDVTYVIERGTRCAGLCKRRKYQSFFYFYCVRRAVNCIIIWRCRNPINWYQVRDRLTPHFSVYNVLTSKLFLISLFLFFISFSYIWDTIY